MRISDWSSDVCSSDLHGPWERRGRNLFRRLSHQDAREEVPGTRRRSNQAGRKRMSRFQDDSAELARRLEDEIEGVISEYWPAWVKPSVKSQDVALITPSMKGKNKRPT